MMKISFSLVVLLAAVSLVFSQQIRFKTEAEDFALFHNQFKSGQFLHALRHLDKFLDDYPESPKRAEAFFLSAECLYSLNQYSGAEKRYELFLINFPGYSLADSALFRLGEIAFARSDFQTAINKFRRILDDFGGSRLAGEAAFWVGESYFNLQEVHSSQNFYRISSELYPRNRLASSAILSLGWTHHKLKDYGKALESYRLLLARFPESDFTSHARQRSGECAYHLKEYGAAIGFLADARSEITDIDKLAETDYMIVESYFHLGDHPNAMFSIQHFLKTHKGHRLERHVRYALGWTYLKESNYEAAAATFAELAEGEDELAHAALFQKGIASKMAGNSQAASAEFALCSRQNGEFRDNAIYELGLIEYLGGNYEEAKALFTEVVKGFPESDVRAHGYRMLGETNLALLKFDEAREAFTAALVLPDAPPTVVLDAEFQEAWAFLKLKQYDEAAIRLERFISSYPDDSRLSEAHFWLAEAHYHAGNYPQSAASYVEVIRSYPQSPRMNETLYGFGWANFRMGDYPAAAAAFEEVLKNKETHFAYDARMRLGDCYFAMQDYASAAGAYRLAARQFDEEPGIDFANYRIAQCAEKTETPARTLFEYLNFIALFPQSEFVDDAMYDIGRVLMQQKDYRSAIRQFKSFTDQFPQSPIVSRALTSTGEAYLKLKDNRRALDAYNKVLTAHPLSESVLNAISGVQECLAAAGRSAEALKVVDDFLQHNPEHPYSDRIALRKPDFLFERQEYAKAAQEFEIFVKQYPLSPIVSDAYFGMAMSYRAINRPDEALQSFRQVALINPQSSLAPASRLELGMLYAQQRMYPEALAAFDELQQNYPESDVAPEGAYEKGMTLLAAEMLENAEGHFSSVGAGHKGSLFGDKCLIGYGLVKQKKLEFAEAVQVFTDVASRRTDEVGAEAQFRVGETLFLLQQYREAVLALQRVREVFAAHKDIVARATLKMGEGYEVLSEKAKAQEAYQSVLRSHKNDEFGREAERKLKGLRGA
ncbi:MAG: tetratricopeptide repeat protein [Bacteroidetes bacterium]|nr:tetratricopeptide repeat protein [Bacteroidota bacterium]MCW5894055.1 tetratricopeptide repeat protein [Bacteroidota bacterium]